MSSSFDTEGRPPSPTLSATTTTSSSTTKASRLERLQSHMLTSILSLQSVPPPNRLPVAKNKEPLSLPTTTRNFRGFVQKSGPVFAIQDAVHETLMWDHPARTVCVMGVWGIIAIYPHLLVPLPTFLLSLLLLQTYQARYPTLASNEKEGEKVKPADVVDHAVRHPTSTGHGKPRPPVVPEPPHEGSVKYYENLRDIQNMMKMITDAYDLLSPLSIHLNWSTPSHTLHIFQSLLLLTIVLFLVSPYLPYRLILFVGGEAALLANHPYVAPSVAKLMAKFGAGQEGRRLRSGQRRMVAQLHEWMRMDSLPDEVWEKGWKDVEVYENERFSDDASTKRVADKNGLGERGRWSGHALRFGERKPWTRGADGFADATGEDLGDGYTLDVSRRIAMTLPSGWKWVEGDEWRIDFVGRWTSATASGAGLDVDDEGWLYTDSDWHRPAGYAYGHAGQPSGPPRLTVGEEEEDEDEDDGEGDDAGTVRSGSTTTTSRATKAKLAAAAEGNPPRAETRRRRWLRRAVRVVGDEGLPAERVE